MSTVSKSLADLRLVDSEQVAEMVGTEPRALATLVYQGILPKPLSTKRGKRWWLLSQVEEYVIRRAQQSEAG